MTDNKKIGMRLKQARIRAGFESATDAARALDIPYPTYAGHENGSRGVVRALDKYARRYKVSLDWLLRGDEQAAPAAEPLEVDELDYYREQFTDSASRLFKLGVPTAQIGEWMIDALTSASSDIVRYEAVEGLRKVLQSSGLSEESALPIGTQNGLGIGGSRRE